MKTGLKGTFVIPWSHTEVDGVKNAPLGTLRVGSVWRWNGDATRVDGSSDFLLLGEADGAADFRRRAARSVRRLVGAALDPQRSVCEPLSTPLLDKGFVLTDGQASFTATEIPTAAGKPPLLMFVNQLPPVDVELWVVRQIAETPPVTRHTDQPEGVICFATGTMIDTPNGPRLIEDLHQGDEICTRDNGAQRIVWRGQRYMSGARLYALPHLRPIRVKAQALGIDCPQPDLIVSPEHRLLVRGAAAQSLFGTPEVLVAAKDLLNDHSIMVDTALKSVTYVHLMLEQHQVIRANGVDAESFHPANTDIAAVPDAQRAELLACFPQVERDPQSYGGFARRNLSTGEAAILQHEGGFRH
jgi:hypothetical protein